MDPINAWINTNEVKELAESLSTSPTNPKEWPQVESEEFAIPEQQGSQPTDPANFETSKPETEERLLKKLIRQKRSVLASARDLAKGVGLLNKPSLPAQKNTPTPVASTSKSELGTFEEIQALCTTETQSGNILAMDRDGDILFDQLHDAALTQFITKVMPQSSLIQIKQGESKSMRLKTSNNSWVEFMSIFSTRGVVLLALKQKSPLSPERTNSFMQQALKIINR